MKYRRQGHQPQNDHECRKTRVNSTSWKGKSDRFLKVPTGDTRDTDSGTGRRIRRAIIYVLYPCGVLSVYFDSKILITVQGHFEGSLVDLFIGQFWLIWNNHSSLLNLKFTVSSEQEFWLSPILKTLFNCAVIGKTPKTVASRKYSSAKEFITLRILFATHNKAQEWGLIKGSW